VDGQVEPDKSPLDLDFVHANAIAEGGRLVLGAQAGEGRLEDVFRKAGFTRFRRAMATPFNLVLEARL
jgi:hypothetical protein